MVEKIPVGEVTHFFSNITVAVIKLTDTLKEGDTILIEGHTTSFEQEARSMEMDHNAVKEAKAGQSVGMKVNEVVREGDMVYLLKD